MKYWSLKQGNITELPAKTDVPVTGVNPTGNEVPQHPNTAPITPSEQMPAASPEVKQPDALYTLQNKNTDEWISEIKNTLHKHLLQLPFLTDAIAKAKTHQQNSNSSYEHDLMNGLDNLFNTNLRGGTPKWLGWLCSKEKTSKNIIENTLRREEHSGIPANQSQIVQRFLDLVNSDPNGFIETLKKFGYGYGDARLSIDDEMKSRGSQNSNSNFKDNIGKDDEQLNMAGEDDGIDAIDQPQSIAQIRFKIDNSKYSELPENLRFEVARKSAGSPASEIEQSYFGLAEDLVTFNPELIQSVLNSNNVYSVSFAELFEDDEINSVVSGSSRMAIFGITDGVPNWFKLLRPNQKYSPEIEDEVLTELMDKIESKDAGLLESLKKEMINWCNRYYNLKFAETSLGEKVSSEQIDGLSEIYQDATDYMHIEANAVRDMVKEAKDANEDTTSGLSTPRRYVAMKYRIGYTLQAIKNMCRDKNRILLDDNLLGSGIGKKVEPNFVGTAKCLVIKDNQLFTQMISGKMEKDRGVERHVFTEGDLELVTDDRLTEITNIVSPRIWAERAFNELEREYPDALNKHSGHASRREASRKEDELITQHLLAQNPNMSRNEVKEAIDSIKKNPDQTQYNTFKEQAKQLMATEKENAIQQKMQQTGMSYSRAAKELNREKQQLGNKEILTTWRKDRGKLLIKSLLGQEMTPQDAAKAVFDKINDDKKFKDMTYEWLLAMFNGDEKFTVRGKRSGGKESEKQVSARYSNKQFVNLFKKLNKADPNKGVWENEEFYDRYSDDDAYVLAGSFATTFVPLIDYFPYKKVVDLSRGEDKRAYTAKKIRNFLLLLPRHASWVNPESWNRNGKETPEGAAGKKIYDQIEENGEPIGSLYDPQNITPEKWKSMKQKMKDFKKQDYGEEYPELAELFKRVYQKLQLPLPKQRTVTEMIDGKPKVKKMPLGIKDFFNLISSEMEENAKQSDNKEELERALKLRDNRVEVMDKINKYLPKNISDAVKARLELNAGLLSYLKLMKLASNMFNMLDFMDTHPRLTRHMFRYGK